MFRIDAHHHVWRYKPGEYSWLEGNLASLRHDFMLANLEPQAQGAGVMGTVVVQARQSVEETDWLLELAAGSSLLMGVVGWLPLRDPNLPTLLSQYCEQKKLKGLRHVVQGEAPGFLDDSAFNAGIRTMQGTDLVYDLLIFERQLEEAARFVDRHPNQVFVLDHIAKPRIAAGGLEPWAKQIRKLAQRHNVFCKISGLVTEADPQSWSVPELTPYFETVLEAFGPARLMAGTDWPVLCAGCSYQQWWSVLAGWVASFSAEEQADVLGRTTAKVYNLQVPGLGGHSMPGVRT